jgi:hypothetical protein
MDLILTIIDRLLKYAIFILYLKSTIIGQLVDIVIHKLVLRFRMLEEFITNRDKLFILNIWQLLIDKLRVYYKILTLFYP